MNPQNKRAALAFGLRTSVLGLCVFALAACATLARSVFATPVVELKDIKMKSIGFQGGAMDVILDVTNGNDYRLDASHFTYNFYVDTLKIASGEVKQTATLEPHRKTPVTLPLTFSIQELVRATQVLSQTGGVDYHVNGEVTAATPTGSFTRTYASAGHFDNIGSIKR